MQNLLIFAIFKSSENWCPGYLKHALSSSDIHLAAAKSLEIIGHVTNCCKRPIDIRQSIMQIFAGSRYRGSICPTGAKIGSSYREFREIEGSRNRG